MPIHILLRSLIRTFINRVWNVIIIAAHQCKVVCAGTGICSAAVKLSWLHLPIPL